MLSGTEKIPGISSACSAIEVATEDSATEVTLVRSSVRSMASSKGMFASSTVRNVPITEVLRESDMDTEEGRALIEMVPAKGGSSGLLYILLSCPHNGFSSVRSLKINN